MNEQDNSKPIRTIIEELKSYGHSSTIWTVNRDGDYYYIECPECNNLDLTSLRLFGCKKCHTRFTVNSEDGVTWQHVESQLSSPSAYSGKLKLIKEKPSNYFAKVLYGRNERRLDEIKKDWPDARLIVLDRDYRPETGKDAHGHDLYQKYILIPI